MSEPIVPAAAPASRRRGPVLRTLRGLRARPRLLSAIGVGLVVFILLPLSVARQPATRALVAWNAGALLYLALVGWLAWR